MQNFQPNRMRPHTSKVPSEIKPRPLSTVRPKTGLHLPSRNKALIPEVNKENNKSNKNIVHVPSIVIQTKNFNLNTNKNYRMPRSASSCKDKIFNKYWDASSDNKLKSVENVINVQSIQNSQVNHLRLVHGNQNLNREFDDSVLNRNLYKYPKIMWDSKKIFNFLTTIGGSELDKTPYRNNAESSMNTTQFTSRPGSANINLIQHNSFNKKNLIDNRIRPVTSKVNNSNSNRLVSGKLNKPNRPMTAANDRSRFRPMSAKINIESVNKRSLIYEDSDYEMEVDDIIDEILEESLSINKNSIENRSKPHSKHYPRIAHPKVDALLKNYENINPKGSSIKIHVADSDLLEIFDRSQRTLAATLSKTGDYEYYSSYQRIGSFMDFSEHLKLEDLKNIEKNNKYAENNNDFHQSKKPKKNVQDRVIIINSKFHRDPDSMFHGFMKFEADSDKIIMELGKNNKTYDPIDFLPKFIFDKMHDPRNWPEEFLNKIMISITNYKKYIFSDKILISDLIHFNKKLNKKFLTHISINLLKKHREIIEDYLYEIEEYFYFTMKNVILEYVLRSPFERKRLNIQYLPRKAVPSSYTIAEHGSFNRNLYTGWVDTYASSREFLIKNLTICNIVSSTLCDWTQNFSHMDMLFIKGIKKQIFSENDTIHINEFYKNETIYLKKAFNFIKDIYIRGALLITKKNKVFKKRFTKEGKWTFKGFVTKEIIEENIKSQVNHSTFETVSCNGQYVNQMANTEHVEAFNYNDELYGMDFIDGLEDFWSNLEIKDLIDIRVSPSYFAYVTLLKKSKIDLSTNEYEDLPVEEKLKLNSSVTTYITVFLRSVIEKTVESLNDYISSFKFSDDIFTDMQSRKNFKFYNLNSEIYYREKEIKLPNLRAFMIREYVKPVLNIKTKYDTVYNVIRFEYTFDQVIDFFLKLIDSTVLVFNSLYTTHFLEFKQVTDLEHIQKEHWCRLNELFIENKNEFGRFSDDYFSNFLPNIMLEESENYTKNNLRVGFPNEEIFQSAKNKISKNIKIHYMEMEECLKLFEPLRELTNGFLADNVNNFLENIIVISDYNKYTNYIEKIRTLQRYLIGLPNFVSYSLFCIDTRETKSELMKILNDLNSSLVRSLEDKIFQLFSNCIEKYLKIHRQIDKKIITPEELVEMEKIKVMMNNELQSIQKDFDSSNKIYLFLLSINHFFSDHIMVKTEEVFKRHFRFKKDLDEIEKSHARDKEVIENKFKEDKQNIDLEVIQFVSRVNSLDNENHIVEYEHVLLQIEEIEEVIPGLEERIEKITKDEELLYSFKTISFDEYDRVSAKLAKMTLMWKKSAIFYELRKQILTNFSDNIDLLHSVNTFKEISHAVNSNRSKIIHGEEVVLKMSKILEDDIEIFKDFLEITNEVVISDSTLEESLKTKVLNLLESKKLETACKNILFMCYSKKS